MFDALIGARTAEYVGMQSVNDETTLLFILHEASVTQDSKMVRDVHDLGVKQGRQLTDIARAAAQAMNDS